MKGSNLDAIAGEGKDVLFSRIDVVEIGKQLEQFKVLRSLGPNDCLARP